MDHDSGGTEGSTELNLTGELVTRQATPEKGDVIIVKQRDDSGWAKIQLTSRRIKRYKGSWYNYRKVQVDDNDTDPSKSNLQGSVNLLNGGRWYIFSSDEDDDKMRELIEKTEGTNIELQEDHTLQEEEDSTSSLAWDDFAIPGPGDLVDTREGETQRVNEIIQEIKNIGNVEIHKPIMIQRPILNTEVYNAYQDLDYGTAWTHLFSNEDFDYQIFAEEHSLGDHVHQLIAKLDLARSLYFRVKEFFIELHQKPTTGRLSQISQALKTSEACMAKIKNELIMAYQNLDLTEEVLEDTKRRFKDDARDQYTVTKTYLNTCLRMVPNTHPKLSVNIPKFDLPPSIARHTQVEKSEAKRKVSHKLSQKEIEPDPVTGMFQEMDKALSFVDNMTRRTKQRFGSGIHDLTDGNLSESTTEVRGIGTIFSQGGGTGGLEEQRQSARDPLQSKPKGMSSKQMRMVSSNVNQWSSDSSASEEESDDDSDGDAFRTPQPTRPPDPPSRADLRTLSKLEQSLQEMKERTTKIIRDHVKGLLEIESMDEASLLGISKHGVSSWNMATEKLDSVRYVTGGCLNTVQSKLSAREVDKIKKAMRKAKSASKAASDTLKLIQDEVTRRNVSTIPVSQEVSKCAVISKFNGTSLPHIYTWLKDVELAIRQLRIPLTLQGTFIKRQLEGEAMSRVELEIPRNKVNPTKNEVFGVLRKYYGKTFIIMKQLGDKHMQLKPIPSLHQVKSGGNKNMGQISKACMEHLKVIASAEDLALEVGSDLCTILDENYLLTLKSILPGEVLLFAPAVGSLDNRVRFEAIKASIIQMEQTSSQCAIEQSLSEPTKETSKVMIASTDPIIPTADVKPINKAKDFLCYACGMKGHMAADCVETKKNCRKCGKRHEGSQCPTSGGSKSSPPFARGTMSAITTCRICRIAASLENKEVVPGLHGITTGGWVDNDTCPLIAKLGVSDKADFLDKIRVCKCCLKNSSYTSFHPAASCDILVSKGLTHLRCSEEICPLRITTCKDHLARNENKLNDMKSYYSTRNQAICFLSSCDNWRQEVGTIRETLRHDLTFMKESTETMRQPSALLSVTNPQYPYLCSDSSELPRLTNKAIIDERGGTPTFLVFKLQGENNKTLSLMFDTGASFSLFRTDVMGRSLIAFEVKDERAGVVRGIGGLRKVRNWKCLLPLADDDSYQVVSAQSVSSILSVGAVDLKPSLDYIKKIHSPSLDALEVQSLEDTQIDGLIGVKSSTLQPKLITMTSLGVGLYKICLKAAHGQPQYALGGNIPTLNEIRRELGPSFIEEAFQEVDQGLHGFYDMRGSLLVSSEELLFQAEAQRQSIMNVSFEGEEKPLKEEGSSSQQHRDLVALIEQVDQTNSSIYTIPMMSKMGLDQQDICQDHHVCDHKCIKGHKFDKEHLLRTDRGNSAPTQAMLTSSLMSNLSEMQGDIQGSMARGALRDLIGVNRAVEDNYRCTSCLGCKSCRMSLKVEASSAKIEEEVSRLRECVKIDEERKVIICKLPIDEEQMELLAPNFESAKRRLRSELLKLQKLPEKERVQVRDSFLKLRKMGYIKTSSELEEEDRKLMSKSKVNYFIPVSIAYKETSVSTPARITMDASSKTASSHSLNSLLPVGSNTFNIAKLVQAWRMRKVGFFTDISKFYNSFLLEKQFWPLQQMLWDENLDPDATPTSYYVVTLIYGVSCVASLTEIGLEMLQDLHPNELTPLLRYRYIDDLATSYDSLSEAFEVSSRGLEVLRSFGLKSKGTVFTSIEPPEEMTSPDGSVQVIGHSWDTMTDTICLRIPMIILGKKAKGKTTFLRVFEGDNIEDLQDFIPANLSLRSMLSLTASVWDISGQMSPLTAMLWHCIRKACKVGGRDYDRFAEAQLRMEFITALWEIQLLRDYRYPRTQIPTGTASQGGTLFCFSDAGLNFEQSICYASFRGEDGTWSCQFMQAKNLLVFMNRSIPNSELNAAATTSRIASAVSKNNPNTFTRTILCVDSTTVLFWVSDVKSKFDVFRRSRTQAIRKTFDCLYFIRSADNPADTGTRTSVRAMDVSPQSRFYCGPDYVSLGEAECIRAGILTPAEVITARKGGTSPPANEQSSSEDFVGIITRSQARAATHAIPSLVEDEVQVESEATQEEAEVTPGKPEATQEESEVTLEEPEATQEEPEVTLEEPEATQEESEVNLEEQHDQEDLVRLPPQRTCLKNGVLRAVSAREPLVCPLRYGLTKSIAMMALVLKFVTNTMSKVIEGGRASPEFTNKATTFTQKVQELAGTNTFPAVYLSQGVPLGQVDDNPTSSNSSLYRSATLKMKQTVLTYPGVTRARKALHQMTCLLSEDQNDWCRPLSEEKHKRLLLMAGELRTAILLLTSLYHAHRRRSLRARGLEAMTFLAKTFQRSLNGSKSFKDFHEIAMEMAMLGSKDLRVMIKEASTAKREAEPIAPALSFISIMQDIEQAKFYINAATCVLVREAQLQIVKYWSLSKQSLHGSWKSGVLISHHRWRDATAAMSDLGIEEMKNEYLAGFQINTSAPVLPRTSSLYISLAYHIHTKVAGMKALDSTKCFTHRSARMDYMISLHFAFSPGGNLIFQRIKDSCIRCQMKNRKPVAVKFGPLAQKTLSFASPFSICAVDLVGPFSVKQMPHSRSTRGNSGVTKAYVVTFTCRITHMTWGEVCESRKTPDICSAFSRFSSIWGTPHHVTTDCEGGLQKLLREGSFLVSTEGRLFRQLGIKVSIVPVSHHQRNPAEPRCKSIQRLIKGVDLEKHAVTIFGLQDIVYLAATLTNSTPFGVSLRHGTGKILKVLSPLSFISRGVQRERRVLHGPILIPNSLTTYFRNMDEHYKQMLTLYHTVIIPSLLPPGRFIMGGGESCKLREDDVVYFNKRPQSTLSPMWALGRVHEVIRSSDGEVRVVKLKYYGSGVLDEVQESSQATSEVEEDPHLLLDLQGSSAREHLTTRDAREVTKIPIIDDDLTGHFQDLSERFMDVNTSEEITTQSVNLTQTETLRPDEMHCLLANACLLDSGLALKDYIVDL